MPLALFGLDDTLVDRRTACASWAREFAADHDPGGEGADRLLTVEADCPGPEDRLFSLARDRFGLAESVADAVPRPLTP